MGSAYPGVGDDWLALQKNPAWQRPWIKPLAQYWPGGHNVQFACAIRPAVAPYVPLTQGGGTAVLVGQYRDTGQSSMDVAPAVGQA